ncbi:hypothetical protein STCU_11961 [Strigomonas culicis]|uniref:Uncharacterized protein n=1 Tax=Strigomonas culicis TaxID=28005 RepID=S9TEZ9_9TRYP|nr:hypothetical protein STCU_11961 [Strigomonas culicis]|eukprot:EPY15514.1 hypothetical protein STCU_11961 [Strigomonas culicis]
MQSELHRHAQLQELTTYYHHAKDSFPLPSAEAQAEQQRLQEIYHSMRKKHKQRKLQKTEREGAAAAAAAQQTPIKEETA